MRATVTDRLNGSALFSARAPWRFWQGAEFVVVMLFGGGCRSDWPVLVSVKMNMNFQGLLRFLQHTRDALCAPAAADVH